MAQQFRDPDVQFFGYPRAVEAPAVPYRNSESTNPVLSGMVLVIGAWLISKFQFLQRLVWTNAGFDGLRNLDGLRDYSQRWDPIVIPLKVPGSKSDTTLLDPDCLPVLPSDLPGRYRSITDLHAMYMSGELTPLAVVESLLPLIRRDVTPRSHHSTAFIDSHEDVILVAAKASTIRYQKGMPLSILDGIPTAVKDENNLKGYRTTVGRMEDKTLHPIHEESTWPIQKWEEAGGILLGKLNMHELGADTTNNNPNWGTPRNPHNEQFYTGGSSGGAAYAVSAGLIPFALGGDGGGSIRIPSSFCGVYGLKTSHGRVEDTKSTVTVAGPIAGTMSDLEAAYRIMAIPNPSDPTCKLFAPPRSALGATVPRVIGFYKEWFERAEPSVLKLCNDAVTYYKEKLGYTIVDIQLPYVKEGQTAHAFTILSEMANSARRKNPSDWLNDLNPANQVLLAVADQTPARDYLLAQQMRNLLMQHLAYLYRKHPGLIIVTPTTPMEGWPIREEADLKHGMSDGNTSVRNMEYVWLANFTGNPAISCPVGYVEPVKGKGRIPVGLMGMGEWGSEDQLLDFGRECEGYLNIVYPGGRQRPENWEDIIVLAKEKAASKL